MEYQFARRFVGKFVSWETDAAPGDVNDDVSPGGTYPVRVREVTPPEVILETTSPITHKSTGTLSIPIDRKKSMTERLPRRGHPAARTQRTACAV
jgi:hypothetical protein